MDVFRQIFELVRKALNDVLGWFYLFYQIALLNCFLCLLLSLIYLIINYFIDIKFIVDTLVAWVACIGVYYGYQVILRWIKAIN